MPESRKKKAIPFAPCHLVTRCAERAFADVFTGLAGHSRGKSGCGIAGGAGKDRTCPAFVA